MLAGTRSAHQRLLPVSLLMVGTMLITMMNFVPVFPPLPLSSPGLTQQAFGTLPLSFIPNKGQHPPQVLMETQAMGGSVYFTHQKLVLSLPSGAASPDDTQQAHPGAQSVPPVMRVAFEGANPEPAIQGAEPLPGVVHYYASSDPTRWQTNLPTYAEITYEDLYPGIDLHYSGSTGDLKGTYVVAPGADPTMIRWRYEDASRVTVDASTGNLHIPLTSRNDGAFLTEQAPVAWQDINGQRIGVNAQYVIAPDGSITFGLGAYHPAYPLVIDPTLEYSTYLGGGKEDYANGIAVDQANNVYITGWTTSLNFPGAGTALGGRNAFITKLNATGSSLLYSAYLGGSSDDEARAIAVDRAGNAFITGSTLSHDFPTLNPAQDAWSGRHDIFAAKLDAAGKLGYSTYIGSEEADIGNTIALDSSGNAYVGGKSGRAATVIKLSPTGEPVYAPIWGGSGWDDVRALTVDSAGQVIATGRTTSNDYPVSPNALQRTCDQNSDPDATCQGDVFITLLAATGDRFLYNTYLGGSRDEGGNGIAADASGIYITGHTASWNFPTVNAVQPQCRGGDPSRNTCPQTAFVTKIGSGTQMAYSTFLGGSSDEYGTGITVDQGGNAYVTGWTNSPDFPVVNAVQPAFGSGACQGHDLRYVCYDAFVTKLSPNGQSLTFSTFLGGSHNERSHAITLDATSNIYIAGMTNSVNFPTTSSAFQKTPADPHADAFVAKIRADAAATPGGRYRVFLPLVRKN